MIVRNACCCYSKICNMEQFLETVVEYLIDAFAISVGAIVLFAGCFYVISFISWPFILIYCKHEIGRLKERIESCNSDDKSSVERKLRFRIKYIKYNMMLDALKPNHYFHYYVKPIGINEVKDDSFVLFLRGFEKDEYNNDIKTLAKRKFSSFSEYHFTKYINEYLPVFAVGMTNEIEPAIGSRRIYLSEETWQSDVLYLMNEALIIVILVNNKKNCIWEIEQSLKYLSKTIYLVDDIEKYKEVASNVNSKSTINIPLSCSLEYLVHAQTNIFFFSFIGNKINLYCEILNEYPFIFFIIFFVFRLKIVNISSPFVSCLLDLKQINLSFIKIPSVYCSSNIISDINISLFNIVVDS